MIILVAFQVFLITVAVEAFLDRRRGARLGDRRRLGRPRRRRRRRSCATSGRERDRDDRRPTATPARSRRCSPATSRSSWRPASSPSAPSQQDLDWLADVLFVIAVAAYVVLAVLLVARLVRYPRRSSPTSPATPRASPSSPSSPPPTCSAAPPASSTAGGAWPGRCGALSLALWAVLAYTHADRRRPRRATSRASAPASTAPGSCSPCRPSRSPCSAPCCSAATTATLLAFVCLAAFTLGLVLYLIVMTMVFLRWTFQPLEPTEADPPAWIAAGAVAITVLAGSNLLARRGRVAADRPARPVRRGRRRAGLGHGHVLVPADGRHRRLAPHRPPRAAALPPVVLGAGLPARHVRRGDLPDARRDRARSVRWLPPLVLAIALVAWVATFAGLAHQLVRTARRRRAAHRSVHEVEELVTSHVDPGPFQLSASSPC